MSNRDLLKEAIADAKAVKEMAISNAKAALEEAFTPHLQSMLAKKLQEMEDEDEKMEETVEATTEEVVTEEDTLSEEELNELLDELNEEDLLNDPKTTSTAHGNIAEEEEKEEETEETEEEETEEEGGEEEEEEIDLEEMSEEDLKAFIEDVVDEMIASGELEAGHEGMEDEAGAESEEEMTMDADAEMGEESPAEMPMAEGEEELTEASFDPASIGLSPAEFMDAVKYAGGTLASLLGGGTAMAYKDEIMAALKKGVEKVKGGMSEAFDPASISLSPAELMQAIQYAGGALAAMVGGGAALANKEEIAAALKKAFGKKMAEGEDMEKMKEELEEAMATIETLKSELHEMNLLNSKLLYTNKIFKAKNLTESQKVKVLSSFDKAETVKEVKLVFETLSEGLASASPKELVKENKSFASKAVGTSPKQPVVESNDMVNRFKKLAGL